jgi:hypothetical protein
MRPKQYGQRSSSQPEIAAAIVRFWLRVPGLLLPIVAGRAISYVSRDLSGSGAGWQNACCQDYALQPQNAEVITLRLRIACRNCN